jgi:hypothetical protein
MPRRTKSRRTRSKSRRSRRGVLSTVTSTTGRVTRGVTSGITSVGKSVTGTARKSVGSFFGLFGMKKSRKHRRK